MLQKSSMEAVMSVFFDEPTKDHYLIEISKKVKIAHTSVKKNLEDLIKNEIIIEKIEKRGQRNFPIFNANINNETFKQLKKIYNWIKLIDSGLIDFLKNKLMPRNIVIFGSYDKGIDTENSDIDLFVECKNEKIDLKKYELVLKRKIHLHFKENFNNYSTELKNNIINGKILYGYLEAFK